MATLEWLFRGHLKDSHYSFEHDLSLCICPPRPIVQRILVPLRTLNYQKYRILINLFKAMDRLISRQSISKDIMELGK